MKFLVLVLLFLNVSFAKNEIIAEVNGIKIMKDDVLAEYKQQLLLPSHKSITKETVLQGIINRNLGVSKAKKDKLDQDEYIKGRFDNILHNALISKDLESKFAKIKVSDKEVEKYYKDNKEYRTSQILYRIRAVPTKDEVEKGLKIIGQIYEKIKKSSSKFEELARDHSQVATNKSGGDIGFLPPTSLSPEYFQAIKGQKVGYISEPFRTQFGLHIAKVTVIKAFKDIDKNLYKKIVFDIKRDKVLSDYYASLKKSAKVKVYKNRL